MDKAPKPPPAAAVDPLINLIASTGVNPYSKINSGNIQREDFHKKIGNPMFVQAESEEARAVRGRQLMNPSSLGSTPEIDAFSNGGPTPEAFKRFEAMERQNRIQKDNAELYRDVAKRRMREEYLKGKPETPDYKARYPYGRNRNTEEG
jgi:hypothetical protein